MNIKNIDLNLLVYLNALLDERSVSRAADKLSITQPAMSNALKRLRELFDDPLLVRTSHGMTPTLKANDLQPQLRKLLAIAETVVHEAEAFDPHTSDDVFRIMASDYLEATLIAPFIEQVSTTSKKLKFDILAPGDVSLQDIEQGKVDLAINRFSQLPQSFHQSTIWRENFCCLMHKDHPFAENKDIETYMNSDHIWCQQAGWGAGSRMDSKASAHKLGWVDEALWQLDLVRNIRVFTRHYMVAAQLSRQPHLIATIPRRMALLHVNQAELIIAAVPFQIVPIEIKMAWSPLLQHSGPHQWLRRSLLDMAKTVPDRIS